MCASPDPLPLRVRPFRPGDAPAACQIAADTAHFGEPVEAQIDDRRLFIAVFVWPYLEQLAEWCWVAESEAEIVAVLTGCPDTRALQSYADRALRSAAWDLLRGRFRLGRRTLRAGIGYWREVLQRLPMPDLARYPAHLHLNVAAPYRGRGLGRHLMLAHLDQCRAAGLAGVHLSTSDRNTAALGLYASLGFQTLMRYRSPYKSSVARQPVDTLILGLRLD